MPFDLRKYVRGAIPSELASRFTGKRRWVFGILGTVILLGLAVTSFRESAGFVRAITGLATLGGLFGSVSALAAYRSVQAGVETSEDLVATIAEVYVSEFTRSINVIGYGTFIGYCYPRTMWNLGARVMGVGGYPFGRIIWPSNALPTALLATLLLLGATVGVIRLREGSFPPLDSRRLLAFAVGFGLYGLWMFVATGLAGPVWFPLLGISP